MIASYGILIAIIGFIVVIGPLVFIHELGHYVVGRLCGVDVESFSIGMGREVTGWTDRHGTRWKLSALPIGGYVKFAGDMGPASTPSAEWLRLPPEQRARTFQGKAVWQRFLIVAAGPVTNFLLAIGIFAAFFAAYGVPHTQPVVHAVIAGSAADKAGLKPDDRLVSIGGRAVTTFEDIADIVAIRPGKPMAITIDRAGKTMTLPVTVGVNERKDRLGNVVRVGMLGIAGGAPQIVPAGPVEVVRAAVGHTFGTVRTMVDVLGQIFFGERSAKELGGPIQIARFSGQQVSMGPLPLIEFMALISINLGFINLLPIPMLDGGHLFFYLVEMVRRRPLPERAQEWAFRSGLALLLSFMVLVTVNDLGSIGLWQKLASLIG